MKKIFIITVLAAFMAGTLTAQTVKVDSEAIARRIAKSDADLNNDKKNTKAAYWLERGKAYAEAGEAPSTGLYSGMDMKTLGIMFGKPSKEEATVVGGGQYVALTYPNFIAYSSGDEVVFWVPTLVITEGALDTAFKAYDKAYQIDPKGSSSKVKAGIEDLANEYKKSADGYFRTGEYVKTAEVFNKAYAMQLHPAVAILDTLALYNAGVFSVYSSDFENGAKFLEEALKNNFEVNGDVYYYLFHCYYGLNDNGKSGDILQEGVKKYPENSNIVEGLIMFYTNTEGDPKEIVPVIEESISRDPENPALWNGLGGIYYKLDDLENALEAFSKALALDSNDPYNYFRVGSVYVDLGNEMLKVVNETNYTSNTEYQKALDETNDVYMKAITPLEKGHELDPSNTDALQLLKNVTFRLRDKDGMQAKYDKYNELLKSMGQ